MSKKDYAVRFGTLLMASLFLITTIAFTAIIFWEANNRKNNEDTILDTASQPAQTNQTGEDMLEGTKLADFTPQEDAVAELQIIDLIEGSGDPVGEGSTVTAHYTGALVKDGTIFQSSLDTGQPFTSQLSGLIEGWQKGIPGMKAGGKRRLIIPAAQAYGEAEQQGIPANSDLVFDIELVSFE